MRYVLFLDVGMGILLIILAIPMILQKVKPNAWYGFRTRKTLSDEGIWYPANQYAGKALLFAGSVMAVGALALYWIASSAEYGAVLSDRLLPVLWLIVPSVPLVACGIASFMYLKNL